MAETRTAGQRMVASARQALAFLEGSEDRCKVHIPDEIDVRRVRAKVGMSQADFAAYFGVSMRTVQQWEQGRSAPSGAARAFLTVIDREPEAVLRALSRAVEDHGAHA